MYLINIDVIYIYIYIYLYIYIYIYIYIYKFSTHFLAIELLDSLFIVYTIM